MEKTQKKPKYYFGLIGKGISYSFSRSYFSKKFEIENLPYCYQNFDIDSIDEFQNIIKNTKQLKGLNVTIPYKEVVIPFLDDIDHNAKEIGAINTIKITDNQKLIGYNTDYFGFNASLKPYLENHHKKALIFGTGGAAKAIIFALDLLGIHYDIVSRNKNNTAKWTYNDLNDTTLKQYQLLINCTPVGTFPNIEECIPLPYESISQQHLAYDLIYNPTQTEFLKRCSKKGATTLNGLEMLKLQAEKAWEIWMQ